MAIGLLVALLIGPEVTQCVVKYMFTLMPGSYLRNQQRKFKVDFRVYLFNTTNPDEVMQGAKPIVNELGPYVFTGTKSKINVMDNDEEDTVTYDILNEIEYRPDLTLPLTGEEILTLPHLVTVPAAMKIASEMPEMMTFIKAGLNIIFKNPDTAFLSAKVKTFLTDGYDIICDEQEFAAKAVCASMANSEHIEKVNGNMKHLRYSFIHQFHNQTTGNYKVLRGIDNVKDVGKIVKYNGEETLDVFDNEKCNEIKGTDQFYFRPFMEKDDIEYFYEYTACHSFDLHFSHMANFKGHKSARKTFILDDPKLNPECDCNPFTGCFPKGTLDLSVCTEAPMIGSQPHFYGGDPALLQMVDGLSPDRNKHYLGIDFDLLTGVSMLFKRRVQLNFHVMPVKEFPIMANFSHMPYPIFWMDETVTATKSEEKIISRIHFWDIFLKVIGWLFFSIGLITAGICSIGILSKKVPVTPVTKIENTEMPSFDENNTRLGSFSETPDSGSIVEQERDTNDFENYNRVTLQSDEIPTNTIDDDEDEGIDDR